MPRTSILFVAAAAFLVASALLRQYREWTILGTVVFACWAAFTYWREKRRP